MKNFGKFIFCLYFKTTISNIILSYCTIIQDVYITNITKIIVYEDMNKIPLVKPNDLCIKNISKPMFNIKERYHKKIPENFDFFSLSQISFYLEKSQKITIMFIQPSGFDIIEKKSIFPDSRLEKLKFHVVLIRSKVVFSYRGKPVDSCELIKNKTISSFLNKVFFKAFTFERSLKFDKICPIIFQNMNIDILFFSPVLETFYLKSKITFSKLEPYYELNNTINRLSLSKTIKLNLDESLLNLNVFKSLNSIEIIGNVNSIQKDLFIKFPGIKNIFFDGQNFRQQAHKTQLEWVKSFNSKIRVNFSNLSTVLSHGNMFKFIHVLFKDPSYIDYGIYEPHVFLNNTFPDEDFCIYKDFPFNQLVFFSFDTYYYNMNPIPSITCTLFWITNKLDLLILYKPQLSDFDRLKLQKMNELFKKCNFEEKIKLCLINNKLKSLTRLSIEEMQYYNNLILYILEFFSLPLASFVGMIISALSVITISKLDKKQDKKILRQFYYLKFNGIFNFFYCFIQNCRLIYSWPNVFGKGIEFMVFSQYFRIIFGEYILKCLKLCSNFTFIMFSIIRCSMAKDSRNFLNPIYKINQKKLTVSIVLFSSFICFIKLFSFQINYFDPNFEYPSQKSFYYQMSANIRGQILINIFNFLCDLIIYLFFIIAHLIADIILLINVYNNLRIKKKLCVRKMSDKYQKYYLKPFKLLIINTTLNFILKLPGLIEFLVFNRRTIDSLLKNHSINSSFLFFFSILNRSYLIYVMLIISDLFGLISFTVNFFLIYQFNTVFKQAFNDIVFNSLKNYIYRKK